MDIDISMPLAVSRKLFKIREKVATWGAGRSIFMKALPLHVKKGGTKVNVALS